MLLVSLTFVTEKLLKVSLLLFKALVNITDQQIYCDLVAGEEDDSFLKE